MRSARSVWVSEPYPPGGSAPATAGRPARPRSPGRRARAAANSRTTTACASISCGALLRRRRCWRRARRCRAGTCCWSAGPGPLASPGPRPTPRVALAWADRVSLSPLVRATSTGRPLRTSSSWMSQVVLRGLVPDVEQPDHPGQRRPLEQVPVDQPPVARPRRLARPGEAVARQIHQVEARQPEGVQQRGLARRAADPRQLRAARSGRSAGSTCRRWTGR